MVVYTCGSNAVVVSWTVTAIDPCCDISLLTSSPSSPATFLPDTTNTVTVTAQDICGTMTNMSFTVTVARPVLGNLMIKYQATNMVVLTWSNGILESATDVVGPVL